MPKSAWRPRISKKAASHLLRTLGFQVNYQRGNAYHDGHEREDVVRCRMQYTQLILGLRHRIVKNSGALVEYLLRRSTGEPFSLDEQKILGCTLHLGDDGAQELPAILVFHDESTFSSTDHPTQQRFAHIGERANGTRAKPRGAGLMMSSFYTWSHGAIFTDLFNHLAEQSWWSNDSMVAHVTEMMNAIEVRVLSELLLHD